MQYFMHIYYSWQRQFVPRYRREGRVREQVSARACIMYRLAPFKAGCFTCVAWIEQLILNDFQNCLYIKLTIAKFCSYSGNKLAEVDSNALVCDCQLRRERLLKLLTGAWKTSKKSFLPSNSPEIPSTHKSVLVRNRLVCE